MKKIIFFWVIIIVGGFFLKGVNDDDSLRDKKRILYLKEYRYQKEKAEPGKEFLEYRAVLRVLGKTYFDFTSLGAQNFSRDILLWGEFLMTKTNIVKVFLLVCDRMVRNIAFDPRLYEIDIKTGKAIDHLEKWLKK